MKNDMKYELAIFDLDGTVLDTLADLTNAVNHALVNHRLPTHTSEEVRTFVGNGIRLLIERAVPPSTDECTVERVFDSFCEYYSVHCADLTKPYDGIRDALGEIKAHGIRIALLSNKVDSAVRELAERYFPDTFDFAAGERDGIRRKPCPDGVFEIMRLMSVPPERTVYIGDSDVDVDTSHAAGVDCIAVEWGFRDHSVLASHGATVFARTPRELTSLILKKRN